MKIAAAAWPLETHADRAAYAAKLERWVKDAAQQGADLLMFPEYAAMEAAFCGEIPQGLSTTQWIDRCVAANPGNDALHAELARRYDVHILAGSGPCAAEGRFVNRAWLHAPDGTAAHVDKQMLTPWERSETPLVPGDPPALYDTALGRLAILICYDSEFPLLARRVPGEVLLVPSCTETIRGASRIRIAAMARALEGRRAVITSATLGAVADCVFLDANAGRAGHYAPADIGFSEEGLLDESPLNVPGWVVWEHDTGLRPPGGVDVPAHWEEQSRAPETPEIRALRPRGT
ncbi:nitrilase-related carbon-nitrogen hydrolase [Oceaniglobus roseus]|uniref:nitrilase-related carbon-nitrogen hydrolase n=1 Tax=Oceaniglobus roseus TaxID=1737570 RepID=UPI00130004B1|nr:nitrilase-related carbon-nitrogen hydrolase [Kandeliimicrobium roseum]